MKIPSVLVEDEQGRRTIAQISLVTMIVIIIIIATAYFSFMRQKARYKMEVWQRLSAIADIKTNGISQWRSERLQDAYVFGTNPVFLSLTQRFMNGSTEGADNANIRSWINQWQRRQGYDIFLLSPRGDERLASSQNSEGLIPRERIDAVSAIKSGKAVFSDFYRSDTSNKVYVSIYLPLRMQQANIGILVMRIDPTDYLYPFISHWPVPSKTAETLLVHRQGNRVVFLNSLRFQADSALRMSMPLGRRTLPAAMAATGKEGNVEGIDYRGKPVLAALRQIPNSSWALVARMDITEAYAPLQGKQFDAMILVFALLFGTATTAGLIWRHQSAQVYKQRFEAQKALLQSQNKYQMLFDNASDAIFIQNESLQFVDVNKVACHNLGYSKEELLRMSSAILNPTQEMHKADRLNDDSILRYETTYIRADGTQMPVEISSRHIEYEGQPGILSIARDITDRKAAEYALISSASRLRRAEEVAGFGNWKFSLSTGKMHASDGAMRIYGLFGSEWEIEYAQSVPLPEYREYLNNSLRDLVERAIPYNVEFKIRRLSDGAIRDIHSVAEYDPATESVFGVIKDITDEKQAQETIRIMNENLEQRVLDRTAQLENVNTELEAFSYSVSHDLRAPLRSIDGFSLALAEDYPDILDDKARDYINRVRAASQRMGILIDDILRLSRISRHDIKIDRIDLSEIVRTLVNDLQQNESNREVIADIASNIIVMADHDLMRIALGNLVDNAWKFTSKLESTRIEFGKEEIDGKTAFYIRDNGAGFDEKYAGKLFGAFQRLHSESDFPGTGIGLATVKRIIQRHGGQVWAAGKQDAGATFYFTL